MEKIKNNGALALPALVQILEPEEMGVREGLVHHLARSEGQASAHFLARRLLFDPSPDIRVSALEALLTRPKADYAGTLLEGLRHPWAPVVQRAADGQAANNSIRYDSFGEDQVDWAAPVRPHVVALFTRPEITNLKLTNYRGTVKEVLSCLLPYFDGVSHQSCVRINAAGTDIERRHP